MVNNSDFVHGRPASGGLIHFQARLTRIAQWLGPLWATTCGVLAGAGFEGGADAWLRLVLLLLLVDGGWGTLWAAMSGTDWSTPVEQWRRWRTGCPVAALPYAKAGAPGHHLAYWLGQLRAWWQAVLWPSNSRAVSSIIIALPLTLIFSLFLGPSMLILTIAALATMQLGLVWEGGHGNVIPEWDALVAIVLPWMAGQVAFSTVSVPAALLAFCLALAYGTAWHVTNPWGLAVYLTAQLLPPALLILLRHPIAAAVFVALLVPQFALLPWLKRNRHAAWFVNHSRFWLFTSMLVVAVAL